MSGPESPPETSSGGVRTRSKYRRSETPELTESDDSSRDSNQNTPGSLSASPSSPDAVQTKVNTRKMGTLSSTSTENTPHVKERRQMDKDSSASTVAPRPDLHSERPRTSSLREVENSINASLSTSSDDADQSHALLNYSSNAKVQDSGTNINSYLGNKCNLLFIAGVVGVVIGFGFMLYWPTKSSDQNPISSGNKLGDFFGRIESVERKFSNQNSRLWRVVKASAVHVLNETEPRYPVVLLLATPAAQAASSRCIAKRVSSEFEGVYGLSSNSLAVSNIDEWKNMDPAAQKKQLDDQLQTTFGDSRRKAVVIDNLQSLHPDAALMLHGYCDNDNAPFKDVMIVLLLNIDEGKVSRFTNQQVEDYLEQLWSRTLGTDKVKALLSRVANNIIIVDGEDQAKISSIC